MSVVSPTTLNQQLTSGVSGSVKSFSNLISSVVGEYTSTQSNNYTLQLNDFGTCIEMNSSSNVTVTVPNTVPFDIGTVITICQTGTGQVAIANAPNVFFLSAFTKPLTTRALWSTISARQRTANNWVVWGDLTPTAPPVLLAHTLINSSVTATTPSIDTTGADLLVIIQSQYAQSPIANISDSKGNGWESLPPAVDAVAWVRILYVNTPINGPNHTFTKTLVGSDYGTMLVMAFSGGGGLGLIPSVVNINVASSAVTSLSSGPITPPTAGSLIISGISNSGSALPYTIGSGLTIIDSIGTVGGSWEGGAAAYLIQGAASTIAPSWSWTTAATAAVTVASFNMPAPNLIYPPALTLNGLTSWRTVLFDDFTSAATINPTANQTTLSGGANWYVGTAINSNQVAGTNYNVLTTTKAGDISNGQVNPAGYNSSVNGGIFQIFGDLSMPYGQNWQTTLPSPNDATGGIYKYFYAEAYIQFNGPTVQPELATKGGPAWWTITPRYQENSDGQSDHYELDIMEYSDGEYWTYHNWNIADNRIASHNSDLGIDSEWHTLGLLWYGNGSTGHVSVWYDNVLRPGSSLTTGGAGTNLPWLDQSLGLYLILGMSTRGITIPMNVDWVRVWAA